MVKVWYLFKRIKKKGLVKVVTLGGTGYLTLYCAESYVGSHISNYITLPTEVLESEKLKNFLHFSKKEQAMYDKEHGFEFFKRKSMHIINKLLPESFMDKIRAKLDGPTEDDFASASYISAWELIRESSSSNKKVKVADVDQLARCTKWEEQMNKEGIEDEELDYFKMKYRQYCPECLDEPMRTLAQAADPSMVVGLARSWNVDERLLLPPPTLPPIQHEHDIEDMLRKLLIFLPQQDVEKCVQFFTSDALTLSDEYQLKRSGKWCFGGSGINYTREKFPQERVESFFIQALVKHSKFEHHCSKMIEGGSLQLLQRIRDLRPQEAKIQRNIVRTISNICLYERFHRDIIDSGWVALLAQSSNSADPRLRMEASRGLANLDRDTVKEEYSDGVFVLYPRHRSKLEPRADIVFVHGLLGGAFHSWRERDKPKNHSSHCWPESWLPHDLPGCRVVAVEYDTFLSDWMKLCPHDNERRTLSHRSQRILDKMVRAGVGDRPIVWITHSMGGLVVKHMLKYCTEQPEKYSNVLHQTAGVVFYGTPHFGSFLANYSHRVRRLLFPSVEVMELSHDSPKLRALNETLRELAARYDISVLNFGEMQPTNVGLGKHIALHIVTPQSANSGIGEFVLEDSDHLQICKPASRTCSVYLRTVKFTRAALEKHHDKLLPGVIDDDRAVTCYELDEFDQLFDECSPW